MATIMLATVDSDGSIGFLYHPDEALDGVGEESYQKMIPIVCFTMEELSLVGIDLLSEYISEMSDIETKLRLRR